MFFLQRHPDMQARASTEQDSKLQHSEFVELSKAYSVLSKPESRAQYDARIKAMERGYYKAYDGFRIYTDAPQGKT